MTSFAPLASLDALIAALSAVQADGVNLAKAPAAQLRSVAEGQTRLALGLLTLAMGPEMAKARIRQIVAAWEGGE